MTQDEQPPLGTVSEEAVKLLAALQEWARESAAPGGEQAEGDLLRDLNEHFATGAEECRYCPICQLIATVRATSPEVQHHLGVAASSLLKAMAGLLSGPDASSRYTSPVEHIDLDDEGWEDED